MHHVPLARLVPDVYIYTCIYTNLYLLHKCLFHRDAVIDAHGDDGEYGGHARAPLDITDGEGHHARTAWRRECRFDRG